MSNKAFDPLAQSLLDFWAAQEQRLQLLAHRPITAEVLSLTNAFGQAELEAFDKLMNTQKVLTGLLQQAPGAPVDMAAPAVKGVPNPVIDHLDMSDPKTIRRFEIQPCERKGSGAGPSDIPTGGILLLVGRQDAHTDAMHEFFTGKGLTVKRLEQNLSEEDAQALIGTVAKEGPVTGMVFAANAYDAADQDRCAYDHTMTAVYLIKHYTIYIRELKPSWRAMVLFTTFLDGKMGLTGESDQYRYGTFNGVAKSLSIEFGEQAAVKLIDFEPDVKPEMMLSMMEDELCLHDGLPEIGRTSDGKRWSTTGVMTSAVVEENRCVYDPQDVLLVTGGSRGVTSQCILALMKKAPCKLVILGRAKICDENADDEQTAKVPDLKEMKTLIARRYKSGGQKVSFQEIEKKAKDILAQRDMLTTFRTLEQTGCQVHYYACNVNNLEQLKKTMNTIEQEVGPVRGIIHGAGMLADCKIWNKEMSRFRLVLDTKYVGLNNILACVDQNQLKLIVGFSSVAGYFGNDGQMDYAAGNEFLDKFAHYFRRKHPGCKTLAINWGAWDGGMMDYIYRKTLTEKGYVLIPMEVGANYFANEFLNGLPSAQILISNNDKPVDATRPAE